MCPTEPRRCLPPAVALLLATLAAVPAAAEEAATETAATEEAGTIDLPLERHRLDNGLRVVLSSDRSVPIVSVVLYFDVGSRNEVEGRTGFAHLFEHMMFEGSDHVGPGEHSVLLNAVGGVDNATTSHDRTNYFQTLPSDRLELALWLEADRMQSLAVTQENYDNQRAIVYNEYRQSYENQPYGLAFLRVNELSFGDYFPYAHSTIGSMDDLRAAPLEAVQEFWRSYYGPNNAVLVIVGDFDPAEALELVRRHFGGIAARPVPERHDPGFAGQTEERVEVMRDPLAPLPAFFVTNHIPPNRSEDHYALEMLADVLGDGDSSRLHRALVEERQLCVEVRAYTDDRRGPDLINFEGIVSSGRRPEEARAVLYDEIDRLVREGITDREFEKVRNKVRARFVFGLQTTLARANRLGEFELYSGDAGLLRTELGRYLAVTSEDIQRVAERYLVAETRSVLDVLPGGPAEAEAEGEEAGR